MDVEHEVSGEDQVYAGSELDTIEVPDDGDLLQLSDSAAVDGGAADKDGGDGDQKEESLEERKARKRNDYQKRLNELVRQRHEESEARAAAEAKAELLEQRLREMEQRKGGDAKNPDELSQREQELIEKRRRAEEDGDLAAYTEAQDALFEVRLQLRQKGDPAPTPKQDAPQQHDAEPAKMVPEAEAWLQENAWFTEKGNEHLAAEAIRIQDALIAEGHDLRRPEDAKRVYAELSRRLRELPEFDAVTGKAHDDDQQEREHRAEQRTTPRNHIAPPSRGGEAPPRPKAGELTQHDIRAMKMVGIDPNDPKARAAYIKRKRA